MSGGRPSKNNAEYFPHYSNLRNHRKVRAVRTKFGQALGLAFWCLILEWLIEHDGLEFEYSEIEVEMLAAELDISAAEIRGMVDYCVKIEMLFLTESNFLYSESLNDKLAPLFEKRQRERERSRDRQRRENGQFKMQKTQTEGVSAAETPQSKVKESKVNKSIEKEEKNKEKKKAQKPAAFDPYVYEFSFFKSQDFVIAWRSFCDHRKAIKKPISDAACHLIQKQLSSETEAVAVELLNKSVANGWTGVRADWLKESDKEKINKTALTQKLGVDPSQIPTTHAAEIEKEMSLRRQMHEQILSSSPHMARSPMEFPSAISIYHEIEGYYDTIRPELLEIVARIQKIPTQAELENASWNLSYNKYPHNTPLFKSRFELWKNTLGYKWAEIFEKGKIVFSYPEPIAVIMLADAIDNKYSLPRILTKERVESILRFYEPIDDGERAMKDQKYKNVDQAWNEYKRRKSLHQDAINAQSTDIYINEWPDEFCQYHVQLGEYDQIRTGIVLARQDSPKPTNYINPNSYV